MATEKPRSSRRKPEKEENVREPLNNDEYPSPRLLELLAALEKRGLLEAATGVLEDEKTFSELMAVFSSDEALSIIQNAKPVIKLLSTVDYSALNELARALTSEKQALSGAKSLIRLTGALESRGLMEPLVGLLNDEKAFSELAKLLSSDSMLAIVNNLQNLTKLANTLDPAVLDALSKAAGSLKTEVNPVKGVLAVTRQLSDPAVAAGMGRLFEILRVLGEDASSKRT
jgi:uncharacterized protein YjgD (DUF1641 family)